MQRIAIVLKHYLPKRYKIALLDQQEGRMNVTFYADQALSPGTTVQYELKQMHGRLVAHDLEIIDMPLALARSAMLFLHHLIELCYHFVPEGSHDDRVYRLLSFALKMHEISPTQQKNMLCLLFVLCDMYPEGVPYFVSLREALERVSLQAIIQKEIDVKIEKYVRQWLYQCIQMHGGASYFKTVHFLDEMQT